MPGSICARERESLNLIFVGSCETACRFRELHLHGRSIDCMRSYVAEATRAGKGSFGNAVLFDLLWRRG